MNHPVIIVLLAVVLSVAVVALLLLSVKPYLEEKAQKTVLAALQDAQTEQLAAAGLNYADSYNDAPVNVLKYGADPTGHTDSTEAIKLALKGNRHLYFPAGTYLIDKLSISGSVTLSGDGDNATVLRTTNMTDNVITFRDGGWHVRDMKFDASQYRTGGAYIFSSGDYSSVENVVLNRSYIGIDLDGSWSVNLTNISALDGTPSNIAEGGCAIRLGQNAYTGPINIRGLTARAGVGEAQPSYGIYMGYVDVVCISDALLIWHTKDVVLSPKARQFSALVEITNSCFDTAANGLWIEPTGGGRVLRCGISNTWFGAHTGDALHVDSGNGTVTGVQFSNCMFLANGGSGAVVGGSGVDGVYFSNCFSGGNQGDGLALRDHAKNVVWSGGVIGATHELNGNVGFAFTADAGTSGRVNLADLRGNGAGISTDPDHSVAVFENIIE